MKLESEVEMTLVPVNFVNEITLFIRSNITHLQCHDMVQRIVQIGGEGQQLAIKQEQRITELEAELKSLHDKKETALVD